MQATLTFLYLMAMAKVEQFRKEEHGAVDIVAIVVMIGIAVLLAGLFRNQIEGLLRSLFESITKSATDTVNK